MNNVFNIPGYQHFHEGDFDSLFNAIKIMLLNLSSNGSILPFKELCEINKIELENQFEYELLYICDECILSGKHPTVTKLLIDCKVIEVLRSQTTSPLETIRIQIIQAMASILQQRDVEQFLWISDSFCTNKLRSEINRCF
ncbi:MAG: hypothetical protein FWC16_01030 [Defluviitaleaceae bacterium]|nr:hypothetical protein [Defluviitaleaceae bacterium]MCL2273488.1 hypothetical protein [Defluviitaleaceae bacterium]